MLSLYLFPFSIRGSFNDADPLLQHLPSAWSSSGYIASIRPSVLATLRAAKTFPVDLDAASPEFEALAIEIFISKEATGKLVKTQGAPDM